MRTQDEILAKIEEVRSADFFGFWTGDLVSCLDWGRARPFLKEEVAQKKESGEFPWKPLQSDEAVLEKMRDYMPFALTKAQDHRGLSAGRSVSHYQAWTWLVGKDWDWLNQFPYPNYGVPQLKGVGQEFRFPLPEEETWFVNMSQGKKCDPSSGYDCGCAA